MICSLNSAQVGSGKPSMHGRSTDSLVDQPQSERRLAASLTCGESEEAGSIPDVLNSENTRITMKDQLKQASNNQAATARWQRRTRVTHVYEEEFEVAKHYLEGHTITKVTQDEDANYLLHLSNGTKAEFSCDVYEQVRFDVLANP